MRAGTPTRDAQGRAPIPGRPRAHRSVALRRFGIGPAPLQRAPQPPDLAIQRWFLGRERRRALLLQARHPVTGVLVAAVLLARDRGGQCADLTIPFGERAPQILAQGLVLFQNRPPPLDLGLRCGERPLQERPLASAPEPGAHLHDRRTPPLGGAPELGTRDPSAGHPARLAAERAGGSKCWIALTRTLMRANGFRRMAALARILSRMNALY